MKYKKMLIIIFVFLISISSICFSLSRYGSTGDEVKQIQTKLKNWGYYTGNVDGIFGSKTFEAVKKFQKANGLTVDGIVGEKFKKDIFKSIDKVEKEATKSKTISSKRMGALTSFMNKIVQFFNAALAAVQQLCVMWLQARIKVVNKFYNATEDKEETNDDND